MVRRLSGLRASLLILVFITMLPALGLVIFSEAQLRKYAIDDVQEDSRRSIQLAATSYEQMIQAGEELLITLSHLPHIQSADGEKCPSILNSLRVQFPQYSNITVINIDGKALCSTIESEEPLDYSDREWFERVISSRGFTIGEFQVNRNTGRSGLVFAYPVLGLAGNVEKIITATLDLNWINNLVFEAKLPPNSTITMIDKNGTILARYPNPDEWVGITLQDADLVKTMLSSNIEGVQTGGIDGIDGIERFYAFHHIGNRSGVNDAVIGVGIPMTVVLAPVTDFANRNLIGLGIATILSLTVAWYSGNLFFIRRTNAMLDATRRLAAGDLSARTGLSYGSSELSELARAFDDMAASIQSQNNVLVLATDELRQSEIKFRTLAETSTAAIAIFQDNGFIYANPALSDITGYSHHELMTNPAWTIFPAELRETYQEMAKARFETGQRTHFEMSLENKAGEQRWVSYSAALIEHNGKPALLATGFDITQRKFAEQAIERQLAELQVLYTVSRAATEATDLDQFIAQASKIIGDLIYPETFGIVLVDREYGLLRFHPSYHTSSLIYQESIPIGGGIMSHVVQTGATYYAADVQHDPYYLPGEPNTYCEICVPIWIGGEVFGVINAEAPKPNSLSKDDSNLLEAVANQVATAVEKIQLFAAERHRRNEAETLREASAALTSSLELSQVLDTILVQLERVLPYDNISVMLIETGQPRIVAYRGNTIETEEEFFGSLISAEHINRVLETGLPAIINDTHQCPSWVDKPGDNLAHAWMGIPLVAKGQIIGLINLEKMETGYYSADGSQLALAYANQAATAIENARLFAAERTRTRELEVIANVSTGVRSEESRPSILAIVLDQLVEGLQAEGAVVTAEIDGAKPIIFEQSRGVWAHLAGETAQLGDDADLRAVSLFSPGLTDPANCLAQTALPSQFDHSLNVICMPLIAQQNVLGAVYIGRKASFQDPEIHLVKATCDIAANAIHRADLFKQTELNLRRLSTLRTIDMAITASINIRLTLDILIEEAITNLRLDAADILLLNSSTRTLEWAAGQGFHHVALSRNKIALPDPYSLENKTPISRAIFDRRPIHVTDLRHFDPVRGPILVQEGFVSAYIVPFIVKGQVKGIMEIFSRNPVELEPDWLGFIEALAGQAAIAIDSAELFNHLERTNQELSLAYDATIAGWSRALDLRDHETEGHSQRVTEISLRLAREVGINNDQLVHLRRGALLHDIGKMGIPDHILLKPGQLTEEEWGIMRQHPSMAYQLLSTIAFLQPALDIPYCHHEKWDGSGYPRGLKAYEIPPSARIFAIADVWDALRSDRPYRAAWTHEAAAEHLKSQSGKHFDPEILEIFLTMLARSEFDR